MSDEEKDDVNESIMRRLSGMPDDTKVEIDQEKDDEFEKLLNSFIASEKGDDEENNNENEAENFKREETIEVQKKELSSEYGSDESELAQAYQNFIDSVSAIAGMRQIYFPTLVFEPKSLIPNYKPSLGRKIVEDMMACWDVLFEAFPEKLSSLSPNSTDEQFLNFAEGLSDQNLQLAIISYVEILIDIENCEISYEERRLKAQRKRIEKALYEEYQQRRERKRRFIDAVKVRDFPIDAERLINNYFKTAAKDVDGAYEVLTTNPAVYAPIENHKIKPRLFGLLKVTPQDGIRENHRIGAFLKKLKA